VRSGSQTVSEGQYVEDLEHGAHCKVGAETAFVFVNVREAVRESRRVRWLQCMLIKLSCPLTAQGS